LIYTHARYEKENENKKEISQENFEADSQEEDRAFLQVSKNLNFSLASLLPFESASFFQL